jgi:hypothetical protein
MRCDKYGQPSALDYFDRPRVLPLCKIILAVRGIDAGNKWSIP